MASNNPTTFPYVYKNEVYALSVVLPAVCAIVVALRFHTRRAQKAPLGADDWLALCGLISVIGMGACLITGTALKAIGYPSPAPPPDITPETSVTYIDPTTRDSLIIQLPLQILLVLSFGLIKLSIILFYRRIFVTFRRSRVDILLIVVAVTIGLWTVAFVLLTILGCGAHVSAAWTPLATQDQYCTVGFNTAYGLSISNPILDIFVFLIPVPLVWRLQMSTKRKIAVIGVFTLGASVVGVSIARLVYTLQLINPLATNISTDLKLASTVAFWWSLLEAGLALIAACLPTLAYLFSVPKRIELWNSATSAISLVNWNNRNRSREESPVEMRDLSDLHNDKCR